MIYIYVFSWIEKLFFHRLHILDFEMLFIETRNQGKKNGNVVRTYIWIRPVITLLTYEVWFALITPLLFSNSDLWPQNWQT